MRSEVLSPTPDWIKLHPRIAQARATGQPVVALESTVITHGLPRPANLTLARQMGTEVEAAGAVPAIVAVLDGKVQVGLDPDQLERIAKTTSARKVSRRDLAVAVHRKEVGGTTVAATVFAANAAGISVFATGGIGGVHRGAGGDVSADLPELARTPVAVVSSGAKSILDLSRTLEWLETAGVPLIGWKTDTFPAFFSRESEHELDVHVQKAEQAAALVRRHWNMGLTSGVLLCVPCPAEAAIDRKLVESALDQAEREAQARQVTGKSLTPFLLTRLVDLTGGATLQANLALLRNNASVAAQLAVALSGLDHSG